MNPVSASPDRLTRTHWTTGSDDPALQATRAVPTVLVSEKPAEGLSWRIETTPDRRSFAASVATLARHAAFVWHPLIRAIIADRLPAASSLTSSVIAVCSVPSMLKTRASTALMTKNRSSARTIPTR